MRLKDIWTYLFCKHLHTEHHVYERLDGILISWDKCFDCGRAVHRKRLGDL